MVVLISLPEVGVPDCRATSGGAGDLWLQGTCKQGGFEITNNSFLNHTNSGI